MLQWLSTNALTIDRLFHWIHVVVDLGVPVSKHEPTKILQGLRSWDILSAVVDMRKPVRLDDDHALDACEVDDVVADQMLATKLEAAKRSVAESAPESALRGHVLFTEGAGQLDFPVAGWH
jgi:hypothetical protein